VELIPDAVAEGGPLTVELVLSDIGVVELACPELDGVVLEDTFFEELTLVLDRVAVIVELVLEEVAVEKVLAEGLMLDEVDEVGIELGLN